MLTDREKLKNLILVLSKKYNFRPAIVEKDYYLTIILTGIEPHLSGKLVFKGGTLLNKIYLNYQRLSEDLDFIFLSKKELTSRSQRSREIAPVRESMPGFLKYLGLKSEKPEGQGFNNSTQYNFAVLYPSFITGKDEKVEIEISLRHIPVDEPVHNGVRHFFKDPFTDEYLIPQNKILSLSLNEAVAEKLKAAITRKDLAIRDYYDLRSIADNNFDFHSRQFVSIFKKKLEEEKYRNDFRHNFGLDKKSIESLYKQIKTELMPVIHVGESFNLDAVFDRFNQILRDVK